MILIVDDRKENIIPLKKILELHNFQVDYVDSGEEALRRILKVNYSLIIMDVQMPGMDGFEVVETLALTDKTSDIPVIFLSAINKEKKYISKGYKTGAVDYITKPVDPDLLILKVKSFYKLSEQKRELKLMKELLLKEIEVRKEAQDNLETKVAARTQELILKNEELELRNHELQQFAWVASHDLKEPLRKIATFSRIVKDKYLKDDEKAVDYISRTIRSADRMTQLINDLLNFSLLSSTANFENTSLNTILSEVISDLDSPIEDKKAALLLGQLPTINCVPSQIRQVFQNLILNSLKFCKKGVDPLIEIKSELISEKTIDSVSDENGMFCKIVIKDNGIGFSEEHLDKIFIIFQRLNDRTAYEGTGIGLSIAKKIIDNHNGIITAKSTPGEGATFIIILPVSKL